jgi:UDP:flavonoid glycosyltransferase YjiC (YdhE family)
MAERCDLTVHHGGCGSVMTGLAAGTPAVIIPTITEQCASRGGVRRRADCVAGRRRGRRKRIDVEEFGAKVQRVFDEASYRKSARRVAEPMRKYGAAGAAADRIEQLAEERQTEGDPGSQGQSAGAKMLASRVGTVIECAQWKSSHFEW